MTQEIAKITELDPVWSRIRADAAEMIENEPILGGLVHSGVLHHNSLEKALSYRMALKLSSDEMPTQILRELIDDAYASDPMLGEAARADLTAVFERDPACHQLIQPVLNTVDDAPHERV